MLLEVVGMTATVLLYGPHIWWYLIMAVTFCSVYFESVTWDDLSDGFETVPGGETYRNRSVLSYHFYEPPQVT